MPALREAEGPFRPSDRRKGRLDQRRGRLRPGEGGEGRGGGRGGPPEKDRRYTEKLRAVGIPPRYQNAVIDSNEAAMFLADFDSRPGSGLYIQGTCGSGKTSLACALARRLFDAKKRVLVTTAIDMLGEIQRTFDDSSPTLDVVKEVRRMRPPRHRRHG